MHALAGAITRQCQFRRHEQRCAGLRGFTSRLLNAAQIGGNIAADCLHLEGGQTHHLSLVDIAPSSFGRSPKRATRLKMTAAVATNRIVTDAMVGV